MTDQGLPAGEEPKLEPTEIGVEEDEVSSLDGDQLKPTRPWMRLNALESSREHKQSDPI